MSSVCVCAFRKQGEEKISTYWFSTIARQQNCKLNVFFTNSTSNSYKKHTINIILFLELKLLKKLAPLSSESFSIHWASYTPSTFIGTDSPCFGRESMHVQFRFFTALLSVPHWFASQIKGFIPWLPNPQG